MIPDIPCKTNNETHIKVQSTGKAYYVSHKISLYKTYLTLLLYSLRSLFHSSHVNSIIYFHLVNYKDTGRRKPLMYMNVKYCLDINLRIFLISRLWFLPVFLKYSDALLGSPILLDKKEVNTTCCHSNPCRISKSWLSAQITKVSETCLFTLDNNL